MSELIQCTGVLHTKLHQVRFNDGSNQEVQEKWNKLSEVICSEPTASLWHNPTFKAELKELDILLTNAGEAARADDAKHGTSLC